MTDCSFIYFIYLLFFSVNFYSLFVLRGFLQGYMNNINNNNKGILFKKERLLERKIYLYFPIDNFLLIISHVSSLLSSY